MTSTCTSPQQLPACRVRGSADCNRFARCHHRTSIYARSYVINRVSYRNLTRCSTRSNTAAQRREPTGRTHFFGNGIQYISMKNGALKRRESPGAGNGTRTRECQLGKLMPYHLAMPAYVCTAVHDVVYRSGFHRTRHPHRNEPDSHERYLFCITAAFWVP